MDRGFSLDQKGHGFVYCLILRMGFAYLCSPVSARLLTGAGPWIGGWDPTLVDTGYKAQARDDGSGSVLPLERERHIQIHEQIQIYCGGTNINYSTDLLSEC